MRKRYVCLTDDRGKAMPTALSSDAVVVTDPSGGSTITVPHWVAWECKHELDKRVREVPTGH